MEIFSAYKIFRFLNTQDKYFYLLKSNYLFDFHWSCNRSNTKAFLKNNFIGQYIDDDMKFSNKTTINLSKRKEVYERYKKINVEKIGKKFLRKISFG